MAIQLRVYVPPHPLIKHWLGMARNVETTPKILRQTLAELGKWLAYEAIREWLPTIDIPIPTPMAETTATFVHPQTKLAIVPILRAGLTLVEGIQSVLPLESAIYHLGMVRDEETLLPSCYLNKLPDRFDPETRIIIAEPMLATGGTIMQAMTELVSRGIDPAYVRIIAIIAAPPALQKLSEVYPTLSIYAAMIDEHVNEVGFIVPGLGDVGDRAFGTN
ncbi:uracil phosphoribosyltransferase [Chamaesiphon polymorphus]|uniref:Uracil phosphoribosyltransferase n=1 Tax=Chamaesiphon polymorphus CCALA 037 TaxID=2107692 RepID=A0A2T1G1Y4_9CYAN|nr:uracil phosphoribosyltransferase [Chamaesiphon polymorphus]PSB51242.1 uracil phosphoribosyltransferase [Chamaesiphon polymorphus CCALA 037]